MREMPDPDERGRAYEATRAHVSAETAKRAGQGRPPDATERGRYWDEVPKFREMWADHERRWPERQPAAEPDCQERSVMYPQLSPRHQQVQPRQPSASQKVGHVTGRQPHPPLDDLHLDPYHLRYQPVRQVPDYQG
jgi:hypothetical protein